MRHPNIEMRRWWVVRRRWRGRARLADMELTARFRRLLPCLAGACLTLVAPAASQADTAIHCDCEQGLGPCGNGSFSDVPGGCLNSVGAKAYLFGAGGGTSVAADDLVLAAGNLPAQRAALVFMGAGRTQLPFGDGLRCVSAGGAGLFRFPIQSTAAGDLSLGPGIVAEAAARFPAAGWIQAGDRWHFQCWYRDPAGPCGSGFNLTSALAVRFEL